MKARVAAGLLALMSATLLVAAARVAIAEEGATRASMQLAYGREVEANARYVAFAHRAERDGHLQVACLFQAAALAESVHAANDLMALEQMGERPRAEIRSFAVRSTVENLKRAIAVEQDERDRVFGIFAGHARQECLYEPLATFNYTRSAEATHAALFTQALAALDCPAAPMPGLLIASAVPIVLPDPGEKPGAYFVCTVDGSLFTTRPERTCPNCGAGRDRIVAMTWGQ
jgi:rubrerythrin